MTYPRPILSHYSINISRGRRHVASLVFPSSLTRAQVQALAHDLFQTDHWFEFDLVAHYLPETRTEYGIDFSTLPTKKGTKS